MKKAIFVGTFDPFTLGHWDIVHRGLSIFDEIVIGIGINAEKKTLLDVETRLAQVKKVFENEERISVQTYHGLTVHFAEEMGANAILRGLRNGLDFEYERTIALANQAQSPRIETFFLLSLPQFAFISSTVVREMLKHGGKINGLVPEVLEKVLKP